MRGFGRATSTEKESCASWKSRELVGVSKSTGSLLAEKETSKTQKPLFQSEQGQ